MISVIYPTGEKFAVEFQSEFGGDFFVHDSNNVRFVVGRSWLADFIEVYFDYIKMLPKII